MNPDSRKPSIPFLALLSLPSTAMGFALSVQISALSWLLANRFQLDIHEVGIVWAAGPVAGIFGQVIVGLISDKVWFWGGRRRPFILLGGTFAALALIALPNLDSLSTSLGLSLFVTAILVAVTLDVSINISFNPTRSIIADLTPAGEHRTRGYTIMQTVSGFFGVLAYVISSTYGNFTLIYLAIGVVLLFSWIPALLIREPRQLEAETVEAMESTKETRLASLINLFLAHGFCWLGIQTMFVFMTFYLQEVFPTFSAEKNGQVLAIGFAILNTVGFLLPGFVFAPLAVRIPRRVIHIATMAIMAIAYLFLASGAVNQVTFYLAMGLAGIGWAATVSLPFAIMSDQVNPTRMGLYMGLFNLSVVIPQLLVSFGVSHLVDLAGNKSMIFVISGVSLAISALLWVRVKDIKKN